MQITRRQFLNATCASAIIAAGGGLTTLFGQKSLRQDLFPIPPEVYSEPLFSMTAQQLRSLVGSRFTATIGDQRPVAIVLTEVNEFDRTQNAIGGSYGECFSLVFSGSERRPMPQGTYVMATQGLESFSALLVPVDRSRLRYEIIINHLTR
jgi:hypothetical protein